MTGYDVLVLGGGAAGCVLAARLSEDPGRTVCLVEAGPDPGPDPRRWPEPVLNARLVSRREVWEEHVPSYRVRARIIGGSSCINGCWHTWGTDRDCAEWAAVGGPRWSTTGLEPYRLSAVAAMRLRRPPADELNEFTHGAFAAARALGYPAIDDLAAPSAGQGYGVPPVNAEGGRRRNAAFAYLDPARSRPGLTILDRCTVDRLEIRGGAVRRAEVVRDGRRDTLTADTYVLACGTFGTPAVLMRSGAGAAADLAAVGVSPVLDLPGVGANLSDHPGVFLPLRPSARLNAALAGKDAAGLLYVSRVVVRAASPQCPPGAWDLHLLPTAGAPLYGRLPPGEYEAGVSAFLVKPASRGRVRLRSADPAAAPDISPAFLTDPAGTDLARIRHGLRRAEDLAGHPAFAGLAAAAGRPASELSDAELRSRAGAYFHPVGTCAMGADDDPLAVTDPVGRVRGVDNLRVADASVLPSVPAANTQLPVLAVAEMLAAALRFGAHC